MRRCIPVIRCSGGIARSVLLACMLIGVPATVPAQVDFQPHRGTLFIPKDCRFEPDKERCAVDNKAIDFCRKEKDADAVHNCLRANQSPLACEARKSGNAKERCERINRIYQPCKGKRGDELAACVDQHRAQEKRKRK